MAHTLATKESWHTRHGSKTGISDVIARMLAVLEEACLADMMVLKELCVAVCCSVLQCVAVCCSVQGVMAYKLAAKKCWYTHWQPYMSHVTHTYMSHVTHMSNLNDSWRHGTHTASDEGRVCPSIEFEFISTKMEQDFSVPIKSITRLVLKKT